MAKMDLHRQSYDALKHIAYFLDMCKKYGPEPICDEFEENIQKMYDGDVPVTADTSLMKDVEDYIFVHEHPKNKTDASIRLNEVERLLKIRRLRSNVNLIKVLNPFVIKFHAPFKKDWDDKWRSILVDADEVPMCTFDLPHQQKANFDYDIGSYVANLLNDRVSGHEYVGVDIPYYIDSHFSKDHLNIYYSTK